MDNSDKVEFQVLTTLSDVSVKNSQMFLDLLDALYQEYQDKRWVNSVLISMDAHHSNLLNVFFVQDAYGWLTKNIIARAEKYLTPKGEQKLNEL